MENQLDSIVFWTFVVNLSIAFIIMVGKRCMSKQTAPEELTNYLVGIFTTNIALMIGVHMQFPYRYQLYLENGLTHSTISKIMCLDHLINAFWNILLPFLIKAFGHRKVMTLAAILMATGSFLMGQSQSSITFLVLATCLSGLTMPTIMRCMADIWQLEERTLPSEWNANYVYNEARSFTSLLITWITSPVSSYIASRYGVSSIFSLTPGIALAAIIPINYFIRSPKEKQQQENQEEKVQIPEKKAHFTKPEEQLSIWSELLMVRRQFVEKKITFFIVLLHIIFHISFFLMHQRKSAFILTKKHKPPMGFVSGAYGVLDLIGAQFMSLFASYFSYKVWLVISSIAIAISSLGVYIFYDNKLAVFISICLSSCMHSTMMTNMFFMDKEYLPSNLRNYFVSLMRFPTSIISCLIMWFWRTERIELFALLSSTLMFVCAILFTILAIFSRNHIDHSDEKKLLGTEDSKSNLCELEEEEEEQIEHV